MSAAVVGGLIAKIADPLIDRLFPDQEAAAQAKLQILELEQQGELAKLEADMETRLAQMRINEAEATHGGWFRAGWRPFVGWVCASAFAYHFVAQPFLLFALVAFGVEVAYVPDVDIVMVMGVLSGLLGMGGYRTYEKTQGIP